MNIIEVVQFLNASRNTISASVKVKRTNHFGSEEVVLLLRIVTAM